MAGPTRILPSLNSIESFSSDFAEIDEWLSSLKSGKVLSTASNENSKLNSEIHLAITNEPLDYLTSICDQLFPLYRDVQHRPFILQFLPSLIIVYYDVLYHHLPKSADASIKDVCTTIDTFLVGLYNLSVVEHSQNARPHEFRIPNLTQPSIYHIPNSDYYAPTPLTQHAVSKHEKKCERVHLQSFTPLDTVNATTREQILWFLLIQYGMNVSLMDVYSQQAYFQMSNKLLGQGFSFNDDVIQMSTNSSIPLGRRIHVSSRVMSEILGTLCYFKANSKVNGAAECMRLLKHRAEYELYADVILMTESMGYLHEFETQRPEKQDSIGIEIELPPTVDMVRQKRTATTARSMKNRQRSHKHHQPTEAVIVENDLPNDTIEHLNFVPVPSDATATNLTPPTRHRQRSILDVLGDNSPTNESVLTDDKSDVLPVVVTDNDKMSNISSPMESPGTSASTGVTSSPSPTSRRQYRPLSLTSTQTYFKTLQQQPRASSPNSQHVQTVLHYESDTPMSRTSSMKRGERRETVATVRFVGTDENRTNTEETYL